MAPRKNGQNIREYFKNHFHQWGYQIQKILSLELLISHFPKKKKNTNFIIYIKKCHL